MTAVLEAEPETQRTGGAWGWFTAPTAPANLSLLRIGVGLAAALTALQSRPWSYAGRPEALEQPSALLGGLVAALPRGVLLQAASIVFTAAAVSLAAGWWARRAALLVAVLGVYVLGVLTIWGKVDHFHHLVWLAAILAVSPCADALVLGRSERSAATSAHGVPLRLAWILIAVVYWAPGAAKLAAGRDWIDHLDVMVANEAWFHRTLVTVPAWAFTPMAIGTIVMEVGFVIAVFTRFRALWAVAAFTFHVGAWLSIGISFPALMLVLPAVVAPFRARSEVDRSLVDRRPLVVGGILLVGAAAATVTFTQDGWPFAAYPLFDQVQNIATVQEWVVGEELLAEVLEVSRSEALAITPEEAVGLVGCDDLFIATFDTMRGGEVARVRPGICDG